MTFVYHGTDAHTAVAARTAGILPRAVTGRPSTWSDAPSDPDLVYLTRLYPGYYAQEAARRNGQQRIGIVEVDLDCLDPQLLYPDEDYLVALQQAEQERHVEKDWQQEAVRLREQLRPEQHRAGASLKDFGNVAYRGAIPPEAVRRISLYELDSNPQITKLLENTTLSLASATMTEGRHRVIIRWLMGEPLTVDEWTSEFFGAPLSWLAGELQQQLGRQTADLLGCRSGLHLIP